MTLLDTNVYIIYVDITILVTQVMITFSKDLTLIKAMNIAIKIINKIRGGHNSLSHRKFKEFLQSYDSEYGDLLLYTEVRWLSRGKSLERVFNLRKEIIEFLKSNCQDIELISAFEDQSFQVDLAFLYDVTEILNEFNLALQGKNMTIFQLSKTLNVFYRKLSLLIDELKNNNIINLKKLSIIFQEFNINDPDRIKHYNRILEHILFNYRQRFKDIKSIETLIELYEYPLTCIIENQDIEIQEELKRPRNDFTIPLEVGENFWRLLDENKYGKIKNEIYKLFQCLETPIIAKLHFLH